jgi:hypothetical protein
VAAICRKLRKVRKVCRSACAVAETVTGSPRTKHGGPVGLSDDASEGRTTTTAPRPADQAAKFCRLARMRCDCCATFSHEAWCLPRVC